MAHEALWMAGPFTRGVEVGSVSSSQLVALWWEDQAGFEGQALKPTVTLAFPLECMRFTSPPRLTHCTVGVQRGERTSSAQIARVAVEPLQMVTEHVPSGRS